MMKSLEKIYSTSFVPKGSVVTIGEMKYDAPYFIFESSAKKAGCYCSFCFSSFGDETDMVKIHTDLLFLSLKQRSKYLRGYGFHYCESCLNAIYCSDKCKRADQVINGHWVVCGSKSFTSYTKTFPGGDIHEAGFLVMAKIIAESNNKLSKWKTVIGWSRENSKLEKDIVHFVTEEIEHFFVLFPVDDVEHVGSSSTSSVNKTTCDNNLQEEESWTWIIAILNHGNALCETECAHIFTYPVWRKLLRSLRSHLVALQMLSPYVQLCKELPNMSNRKELYDKHLIRIGDAMNFPEAWSTLSRISCGSNNGHSNGGYNITLIGETDQIHETIVIERKIARIAQSASLCSEGGGGDDTWPELNASTFASLSLHVNALIPLMGKCDHSCLPNASFEVTHISLTDNLAQTNISSGVPIFSTPEGSIATGTNDITYDSGDNNGDDHQIKRDIERDHSSLSHCIENGEVSNNREISAKPLVGVRELFELKSPTTLCVQLVALRDINQGEELTVTYANVENSRVERQAELRERFGPAVRCQCMRCEYEITLTKTVIENTISPFDSFNSVESVLRKSQLILDMADQAMQVGDFARAADLYGASIKNTENNIEDLHIRGNQKSSMLLGMSYHGRGAALLGSGDWLAAHQVWKEAGSTAGNYDALREQVAKLDAYSSFDCVWCPECGNESKSYDNCTSHYISSSISRGSRSSSDSAAYECLLPSRVYISTTTILSREDCEFAISAVEQYAQANGGWTTSRHYAVPTTDLPIHTMPILLKWFNKVLEEKIFPILVNQFCQSNNDELCHEINGSSIYSTFDSSDKSRQTSTDRAQSDKIDSNDSARERKSAKVEKSALHECIQRRCRLSVHDAFIVRYSCCDDDDGVKAHQRYLPVHVDESTHSITVSLNNPGVSYDGGGTYFIDMQQSVCPQEGYMLSFKGDVRHGGDPIVRGTRYIIAAFLHMDMKSHCGLDNGSPVTVNNSGIIHAGLLKADLNTADMQTSVIIPPTIHNVKALDDTRPRKRQYSEIDCSEVISDSSSTAVKVGPQTFSFSFGI